MNLQPIEYLTLYYAKITDSMKKTITVFGRLFVLTIVFFGKTFAQDSTLVLLAKSETKGLTLRWIPESVQAWATGRQNGYKLVRKTYMRDGKKLKNTEETVLFTGLKPKPKTFWESSKNQYVNAAGSILYNPKNLKSREDQENEAKYIYFLSLLLANNSAEVAEGLALRYSDATAKQNEQYEYNVSIESTAFSVSILTSKDLHLPISSPKLENFNFIDSTTTINFKAQDYAAYHLYRSDDNGVTYKKRNQAPIVPTFTDDKSAVFGVADTVSTLYKYYYYKIVGITPFAEESPASETIKIYAYYTQLPPPQNTSFLPTKDRKVVVFWQYPDTLLNNIKGFKIIKTNSLEDEKGEELTAKMLPPSARRFTDSKPENENIYRVVLIDVADREIPSMPIIAQLNDTIPPEKPLQLKGKISQKGVASISWSPSKSRDLYGYRIYRGNKPTEVFSLINPTINADTVYSDTISLSLLDKYVYYRIVPIDNHLNPAQSVDTLRLKRPDILAPVAPVITKFAVTDTLVRIEWALSPSEDVVKYKVLRQSISDTASKILASWDSTNLMTVWSDTTVREGVDYTYFVEAIDDSDNSSGNSCNLPVKTPIPYIRPAIKNWKAIFVKNKSAINLQWNTPTARRVNHYTLFKRVGANDVKPYKRLAADAKDFDDVDWDENILYGYIIVATFEDETITKMSNELIVKTPSKKK